ncbi:MAG TPA: FmdB family transcriptional regulator [Kosmotogaceae bacterium]|nr:FmdB family transcriptional regulator [Kosmotogaceae bacterium]
MPIYHYTCDDCKDSFEVFQKMSDQPLKVCPSCGGKLQKTISRVGVVFKGKGFYSTDSKGGNGSKSSNRKTEKVTESSDT